MKSWQAAIVIVLGLIALVVCGLAAALLLSPAPKPPTLPGPTSTPTITPTPVPGPTLPPHSKLEADVENMTEAQWKKHLDSFEGHYVVEWIGYVSEIDVNLDGTYDIMIDLTENSLLSDVIIPDVANEEFVMELEKGQMIKFSGQLDHISELFGSLTIYMKAGTMEVWY